MDREKKRGEIIRRLREERLLTREALAKEAGIATSTVTYAEEGQTHIRFGTLRKIARALNVDPAALFKAGAEEEDPLPKALARLI